MSDTVRTVLASHAVPGMLNTDIVITRIETGAAVTHMVQACSPTRMGGRVYRETLEEARTAANLVWTALRNGARDHGRTTLAHDASSPVPGTETAVAGTGTAERRSRSRSAARSAAPRVTTPVSAPAVSQVEPGDYAIEYGGSLRFFTVTHGNPRGKWAGYTFVNEGSTAIRDRRTREAILAAIAGQSTVASEEDVYGQTVEDVAADQAHYADAEHDRATGYPSLDF